MNLPTNLKKQPYQYIFFDLDGTLTDPKEGITKSIQYALEKMDLPIPSEDQLEWCIGPPLKEVFAKIMNHSNDVLLNTAIGHYRKRYAEKGMYENFLYPDIEWMLSNLCQKGYRLLVATSKPTLFSIEILKHFGLAQYFEKICGSELDGTYGNKGDLLKYILESNSIKEPSLMVGDRKFDVIAAFENGIDSLGVTYGYGSLEELVKAGASHLCHSPTEVYNWIVP